MRISQTSPTRSILATVHFVGLVGLAVLFAACSSPSGDKPVDTAVVEKPPLHAAIDDGNVARVEALIKDGADLEQVYIGRTPLNSATLMDRPEIVERLLVAGAKIDAVDSRGETALFLANSPSLVQPYIKHGADLNHRTNSGQTPLISGLYHGWSEAALVLIDHGADVSAQDKDGATPLMVAAAYGSEEVVARLLREGADVNQTTSSGRSALLTAAYTGRTNAVKLLLEAGADANVQDRASGDSALHYCAVDGYLDIAKLLLAHGADPSLKNRRGATPLQQGQAYSPYPGRVSRETNKDGVIALLKSKERP